MGLSLTISFLILKSKVLGSVHLQLSDMAEQQQVPCADYESYLVEPDESCKDFIMQQTMMRIKDPKRSLDFYTRVLGMR